MPCKPCIKISLIFFRKHGCPKPSRPKNDLFPNAPGSEVNDTEYKTIFLKHSNPTPRESFKPPLKAIQRDSPMACNTTNRVDYVSHPVTPCVPRPPAAYKRPEGTVNGESEYIKEYQYKSPEPVKPILPQSSQIRVSGDKFNVRSTQATDFKPFVVQPRVIYGENRVYKPPTEKFQGASTFQSDFKGELPTEPTISMKPTQETKLSRDAFDVMSSYHSDYKRFQIPDRFKRDKQEYQPPVEKFFGTSCFTSDFPGHRGVTPAQSLKPPRTAKASNEPLEATTTSRMSYQKWDIPPRFSRPPTSYEPPKEMFSGNTVFTDDFVSHGIPEPVQNFKPKNEPIRISAPVENQTINRIDYQPIDLSQRPPLVVKERKYVAPVEKFGGRSTANASYQGQFSLPAASTKPLLKPYSRGVKFEGNSTYKQCYTRPERKTACISGDPNYPSIPGYKFSYEDPRSGHKFYTISEEGSVPLPPALPQTKQAITAC